MARVDTFVHPQYEWLDVARLVNAPVDALEGLTSEEAELLRRTFNIKTIGDLGRNKFFVRARAIVDLADTRSTPDSSGRRSRAAHLAATRTAISRGRVFESASEVIREARDERTTLW